MIRDPSGRRDRVIDGGRKFMFGREPVIDGDDEKLSLIGELAAHHVMRIKIADHPATAVKEHQARRKSARLPRRLRRIDARRARSVRGGDRQRLNRFQFGRFGIGGKAALQIKFAGFGGRNRFKRRAAGFLKCPVYGVGVGIEGCGHGAWVSSWSGPVVRISGGWSIGGDYFISGAGWPVLFGGAKPPLPPPYSPC